MTDALRAVLELPDALWPELLHAARLSDTRTAALLLGEQGALDDLAGELNELRDLAVTEAPGDGKPDGATPGR